MKLTVYRQSSKTRPDGTVVYKGEDALPYVDEQIFFVADGLGGAAAIRHQKIKSELFDKDKLLSTLFEGVYDNYDDERFVKYVTDSFFELFAVKDCYTDNINNIKKSGYFASRIVTAIVLHELIYNEKCSAKSLFDIHQKAQMEGNSLQFLSELGEYFKKTIKKNIMKIAENANLIYESSYSGLALLGSTVCATIYFEHEDCVEAIYLTAGDSRPYVWNDKDGLCQVLEDQEGEDGGMTNYIRANEDADFDIRCNYFRFKKPCMLFNASDGCFDSGKFISQLAFEKLILEQAISADGMDMLSRSLTEFFLEYGRHDDSSTIAMKLFGFDSFEEFKKYAAKRMEKLNEDYFAVMPDLLDADYISEYEQCASTFPEKLASLKARFEEEKSVADYCTYYVRSGKFQPYISAIENIDTQIKSEKEKIKAEKEHIEGIVAQNFIKFKEYTEKQIGMIERFTSSKIINAEEKYNERATDYISAIKKYKTDFDTTVQTLNGLLERIFEMGVPSSFEDFDEISLQIVESCEQSMEELFDFFAGLKSKKLDIVKKLTQQRKEYIEKNIKLAQKHFEDVIKIRKMILSGAINIDGLNIFETDKIEIKNAIETIKQHTSEIARLEEEAKVDALKNAVNTYWDNNYVDVITCIVKRDDLRIEIRLLEEAKTLIKELNEQTKDVKEKCEKQRELFAKYDEDYSKYIGGVAK